LNRGRKKSSALSFENEKHPKLDRRNKIALWQGRSERTIVLSAALDKRTREIAQQGIHALDAAHLASAEVGRAEVFLTCDDLVLRRAPRLGLALRVLNPVTYLEEVTSDG